MILCNKGIIFIPSIGYSTSSIVRIDITAV